MNIDSPNQFDSSIIIYLISLNVWSHTTFHQLKCFVFLEKCEKKVYFSIKEKGGIVKELVIEHKYTTWIVIGDVGVCVW